jgi:PIN domain nuclease of toxin-antitoxin system
MSSVVVDTHVAIWYFIQSNRLSNRAISVLDATVKAGESIYLSAISLVEVIYLVEKCKVSQVAADRLLNGIKDPVSNWILHPIDLAVAEELSKIPRDLVPDMPDRIIGATAIRLGLPLVTCDSNLLASALQTIW